MKVQATYMGHTHPRMSHRGLPYVRLKFKLDSGKRVAITYSLEQLALPFFKHACKVLLGPNVLVYGSRTVHAMFYGVGKGQRLELEELDATYQPTDGPPRPFKQYRTVRRLP